MIDNKHNISMPNTHAHVTTWVDSKFWSVLPNNTQFQQEFAFVDDLQNNLSKSNYINSDKKVCHFESCLSLIHNTFLPNWCNLNFYFYTNVREKRICHQFLYGLPYFIFTAEKNDQYDLRMFCVYKRRKADSFDALLNGVVDGVDLGGKNEILNSHFNIFLLDVQKIKVWNWGFHIITDNQINVIAAKTFVLTDTQVNNNRNWSFPMRAEIKNTKEYTETIAEWSISNNGVSNEG